MGIWLATKTLAAIDEAICADGGNTFRMWQGRVLPHIADAYRSDEDDAHRSHLGASVIGGKCARAIFYGYRWASRKAPRGKKGEPAKKAESRMRRLWNRGHLEEGRFIALLLMIGCEVMQQDAEGKQFRISAFNGLFSGSGDGILLHCPDLPAGVPALSEFKTHSNKSFEELKAQGVRNAKPEHFVQMQEYMHHFGLLYALYMAVNKDTDELYGEIVMYDRVTADHFLERARAILFTHEAPPRMHGANPGFVQCKYMCDHTDVCYNTVQPLRNCRTCDFFSVYEDGTLRCRNSRAFPGPGDTELSKEDQLAACGHYQVNPKL